MFTCYMLMYAYTCNTCSFCDFEMLSLFLYILKLKAIVVESLQVCVSFYARIICMYESSVCATMSPLMTNKVMKQY